MWVVIIVVFLRVGYLSGFEVRFGVGSFFCVLNQGRGFGIDLSGLTLCCMLNGALMR